MPLPPSGAPVEFQMYHHLHHLLSTPDLEVPVAGVDAQEGPPPVHQLPPDLAGTEVGPFLMPLHLHLHKMLG